MADLCLSSAALTVVAMLLASLVTAIGILFRTLLASKDDQIADWRALAQRGTGIVSEALEVAKTRR
jgi:hypothetical protein